ncbi:MAG: uracil-DNA glycosylase [Pseudomonadota bacterium]
MGIDVWVRRTLPALITNEPSPSSDRDGSASLQDLEGDLDPDNAATMDWEALRHRVASCTACELHKTRTQTVFGVGDHQADWLFIGEAPGADEDRQGEPFVGRAGQLLNNMIKALGLRREQAYIANILKCRPPRNRDPRPEESQACRPYLRRQIELLSPRVIVALGRVAAQNLLQTDTPIGRMRGRQYRYEDSEIPVVVTYHPAYLLRSPREKRKVWQDLQMAMALLGSRS